jgi:hypothetical protein
MGVHPGAQDRQNVERRLRRRRNKG